MNINAASDPPLPLPHQSSMRSIQSVMSVPCLISVPFYTAWSSTPPAIRFGMAGTIGNAAFFGLDRMLLPLIAHTAGVLSSESKKGMVISWSKWVGRNAASVSFFVAYLLDIALMRKWSSARYAEPKANAKRQLIRIIS